MPGRMRWILVKVLPGTADAILMKRVIWFLVAAVGLLLAVWVTRALTTWKVNATTAHFNNDVENLFGALQQYKEHVGIYPTGNNAEIVKALMGQNPKKLIILVGRKHELNEKGEVLDPWGTPLRIYFAGDGVLVRSAGPNRRFDDSVIEENDDYYRAN